MRVWVARAFSRHFALKLDRSPVAIASRPQTVLLASSRTRPSITLNRHTQHAHNRRQKVPPQRHAVVGHQEGRRRKQRQQQPWRAFDALAVE